MTATIRVPVHLLSAIRDDLTRTHAFAAERIGWVFSRAARAARGMLLLSYDYMPVSDEHYIDDPTVGARIDSTAIRSALERSLRTQDCVLHVHMHDHKGPPHLSRIDVAGLRELMPSFGFVAPQATHGALVLSRDCASGEVRLPTCRDRLPARVVQVGFPFAIYRSEP